MMSGLQAKGLRKGAWTEEEDNLLRKCVFKFGEGRWHQVPLRAGLNRCRKSCRLRWLNYLKPNIKRGVFADDEVDLIQKLHRLLGNRWSLIAGRLPGRTANDIKNYWNTNLNKQKQLLRNNKRLAANVAVKGKNAIHESNNTTSKKIMAIKPQPRTFSKNSSWVWNNKSTCDNNQVTSQIKSELANNINFNVDDQYCYSSEDKNQGPSSTGSANDELQVSDNWWESLLFDGEEDVMNHENCTYSLDNWWESLLSGEE